MAEEEIHSASLAVSLTRLQDFPGECDKITFCSVSPPTPHSLKVIFIRKVFTSGPTTRASLVAWEVYSEGLARHPHPRRPPLLVLAFLALCPPSSPAALVQRFLLLRKRKHLHEGWLI